MKTINLISIINAYKSLEIDLFQKYLKYFGLKLSTKGDLGGIRDAELQDLESLIKKIASNNVDIGAYDNYFFGYEIPQIGKEFDLLRFGKENIINIELKNSSTEEKIRQQLIRNKYYLSFLSDDILLFSYVIDVDKFYSLNKQTEELEEINSNAVCDTLTHQVVEEVENIDNLFNPSNYLVSPFNSTQKFMEESYFLTHQQEDIKNQVLKLIDKGETTFIAITGIAGTGKTLLTYDIAKEILSNNLKALVLHCAQLNQGQFSLNSEWGWSIHQASSGLSEDFADYDLIIVDEAQRAYPNQFNSIVSKVQEAKISCVFSYDKNQYMRGQEALNNISEKIEAIISVPPFKLSKKIRTNKEIASFINQLLDNKKDVANERYPNIKLHYCKDYSEAKLFLTYLKDNNWKVPQYTPGIRTTFQYEKYLVQGEDSAHAVIGQEYDKLVAVVDNNFFYNNAGKLATGRSYAGYYSQRQMLFQILSRTRTSLYLVVINNEEVLSRCLNILHP